MEGEGMSAGDLRCLCGSLVARVTKGGIELKCRRCKRVALIPLLEKEQKFLQENHAGIFGRSITLNHSHFADAPSHAGSGMAEGGEEAFC